MFAWLPATIRLQFGSHENNVSAIYLVDKANGEEILVTIAPQLIENLAISPDSVLSACLETSVTASDVLWEDIALIDSVWLSGLMSITAPLQESFTFLPGQSSRVSFFRFLEASKTRRDAAIREFAIQAQAPQIMRQSVRIVSSPFAGVNPAMFLGYVSTGTVSYVATGGTARDVEARSDPVCVLVDARYLEGMEGGPVFIEEKSKPGLSIGLVAACLIKSSGEGRLTAVAPWSEIFDQVKKAAASSSRPSSSLEAPLRFLEAAINAGKGPRPVREIASRFTGVVVVRASLRGGRKVWGSGVLISPDIIVTNRHVVGDFLSIEAWFEKYDRRTVLAVSEPLSGVDLVFLRLSKHMPGKFPPVSLAELDAPTNSPVYSVGFGLFYPETFGPALQPLFSRGIISKEQKGSIQASDVPMSSTAMLISSAGCWNGSSGGGLFNEAGQLVGIMASNARDESTNEIMPDMSFVIPVSVVHRGLSLIAKADEGETSDAFQKLWRLQKTHTDSRRKLRLPAKL